MTKRAIKLLPPTQVHQMEALAKRAQISLSRFANIDVQYNAIGLQLLDEWIERHLRQFPRPSKDLMTLWGAFLGKVFRERFNGEWAVDDSKRKRRLGIICPREEHGLLFIDVMDQLQRRAHSGIAESLALYYTMKGIEIKSR